MKGFIEMVSINFQEIMDNATADMNIKGPTSKPIVVPQTSEEKINVLIEFVRSLITEDTQKIKFNRLFPKPKK